MNNCSVEDYRNMLTRFRVSDLKALLEAFGQNKLGTRTELRERSLELLNYRPVGLNYAAYLSKIFEIYHFIPSHQSASSNNNMMGTSMQIQQTQMISMSQIQIPQQRMYQLPQYHQQSMHMPQARLPHSMTKMEGGISLTGANTNPGNTMANNHIQYVPMHMPQARLPHSMTKMEGGISLTGANSNPGNTMANNHIQYVPGSYQPVGSQIMVPSPGPSQMSANQQNMYVMIQNTPNLVLNPSTGLVNNAFIPSPEVFPYYKFKKLPFYDVIEDVIKPTLLNGSERCTLPNIIKDMRECKFEHMMSTAQASLIAGNRDISFNKMEYTFQYLIRICELGNVVCDEVNDYLPIGLHIRVGKENCELPPFITRLRPGIDSRRMARPIKIAQYLKICPFVTNYITINWIPDGKKYALAMYIVKHLSVDTLMKRLQDKEARSSEETKNYIIKKLTVVDPDLTATPSYSFSLVCPLSKIRMEVPAKSIHCDHIQCFDAGTFILMNEKNPKWMCPLCNKSCLYDEIQIENYFLEIITSPTLPGDINKIEVLADGSWIIPEENKDTKNMNSTTDNKGKPNDFIDLDDDDDRSGVSECQEYESLNPHLVDLTIEENEEPPKDKP